MYTRENPSPEYREMVEMYSTLHEEGAETERTDEKKTAKETFSGKMLMEHAPSIGEMISRTGSRTLLDYGAGKGQAYELKDIEIGAPPGDARTSNETLIAPSLKEYWKLESIRCYDPGHEPFSQLPTERFDGTICIDVLEHITAPDLPWVLEEIFGFANRFVFANIACYPAKKHLPNGQNAHCTVRSPDWWIGLVHGVAMRHTNVSYRLDLSTKTGPRKKIGGLYGKRSIEHQTVERWA